MAMPASMRKIMKIKTFSTACLAAVILTQGGQAHACWEEAAKRYGINPYLLYAVAKTESGLNPSARNRNKNGTYDIGLMQINSSWLPKLRQYGVDEKQLLDPCTSIHVGAWILAQNMQRFGNSWAAVGAYNSTRPEIGMKYAARVYKNLPPAVLSRAEMR
jgi:soluble lytic murein transglycosylase-like protein